MLYAAGTSAEDRAPMGTRHVFVGRDHELGDVSAAFDDALAGRGALFLLVGRCGDRKDPPGRRDRRAGPAATGLVPYWGRCWETGGAPAYWPWIQILRELGARPAGRRPAGGRRARRGGGGASGAGAGRPRRRRGARADPAQARFRLFDAVTSLLKAGLAGTAALSWCSTICTSRIRRRWRCCTSWRGTCAGCARWSWGPTAPRRPSSRPRRGACSRTWRARGPTCRWSRSSGTRSARWSRASRGGGRCPRWSRRSPAPPRGTRCSSTSSCAC